MCRVDSRAHAHKIWNGPMTLPIGYLAGTQVVKPSRRNRSELPKKQFWEGVGDPPASILCSVWGGALLQRRHPILFCWSVNDFLAWNAFWMNQANAWYKIGGARIRGRGSDFPENLALVGGNIFRTFYCVDFVGSGGLPQNSNCPKLKIVLEWSHILIVWRPLEHILAVSSKSGWGARERKCFGVACRATRKLPFGATAQCSG